MKELTYKEAFSELHKIIQDIENENIDIDILSEKIKRASKLMAICQAKLSSTEKEVHELLQHLEEKTHKNS